MIRINLLPVREARKAANLRKQVALMGVAACVGIVISIGMHANLAAARSKQQRMIAAARTELQELEKTRKEVERFRQEREEIERKLNVIENLQASREGPVRVMDEIATRIPKRMWLTELTMDQGSLNMKGVSLDAEIVAAFLGAPLDEYDVIFCSNTTEALYLSALNTARSRTRSTVLSQLAWRGSTRLRKPIRLSRGGACARDVETTRPARTGGDDL